ncbi:DsbA family protein [Solidesulfovibrio sp. C21]|uniref:DsbA family protein n=1 Tax=Solidesulfovibrio sp. C21 TaxID=3398613 RepID=UPI0039FD5847
MKSKVLFALVVCLVLVAAIAPLRRAVATEQPVDSAAVFDDPSAPVTGNPKGDVTIVEFSDYNCPFCKQSAAALEKLVKSDGKIRVVHKDWPVLTDASAYGARLALAAGYQGKYAEAHAALMQIPGMRISKDRMLEAVKASGLDMDRLESDLKVHAKEIAALLERNSEQAETLGLQGTPAFLVGPYIVPSALGYNDFKQVVADARTKIRGDR